jgi:hypothetical protein
VGHFALLDPDPDSEYGAGSTDLIESGSNPDPDPKPSLPNPQRWPVRDSMTAESDLLYFRWSSALGPGVAVTLCRTFQPVQKKNSVPSNLNFLKEFGLKKNTIFVGLSW